MPTSTAARTKSRYSRIWSGAKVAGLSSDEVHDIVSREFKKDSLKELTDRQVEKIGNIIWDINSGRRQSYKSNKRTDEGGRTDNVLQRRRIFKLAETLGWSVNDINGFCFSQYEVSRHEWLPPSECSDMIEALKAMIRRKEKKQTTS